MVGGLSQPRREPVPKAQQRVFLCPAAHPAEISTALWVPEDPTVRRWRPVGHLCPMMGCGCAEQVGCFCCLLQQVLEAWGGSWCSNAEWHSHDSGTSTCHSACHSVCEMLGGGLHPGLWEAPRCLTRVLSMKTISAHLFFSSSGFRRNAFN